MYHRIITLWVALFLIALPAQAQQDDKEKEDKTDYWKLALEKIKATSYGEAVNALNTLLEKTPSNALAYQKRAFAKRKMGNAQGAEEDYTSALAQNAQLAEAYLGRAQARIKLGSYDRAIEDYSQTLTRLPAHPRLRDIFYNRGLAYLKVKKNKEAISDFREALKIDSDFAQAWVNLAFIYYFSGDIRKACVEWLRARDLKSTIAKENAQRACQCCM